MDARLFIDTAVLLAYFVLIIGIGLRMGRKEDNLEEIKKQDCAIDCEPNVHVDLT